MRNARAGNIGGRDLERMSYPAGAKLSQDIDLVRAVRQLPPQQRAAVALFYFEDRPLADVAHILIAPSPP